MHSAVVSVESLRAVTAVRVIIHTRTSIKFVYATRNYYYCRSKSVFRIQVTDVRPYRKQYYNIIYNTYELILSEYTHLYAYIDVPGQTGWSTRVSFSRAAPTRFTAPTISDSKKKFS